MCSVHHQRGLGCRNVSQDQLLGLPIDVSLLSSSTPSVNKASRQPAFSQLFLEN